MPEVIKDVKLVEVNFLCEECEVGFMQATGQCFTSNPPQYPHKCDNSKCNKSQTFMGVTYPYTKYIPA